MRQTSLQLVRLMGLAIIVLALAAGCSSKPAASDSSTPPFTVKIRGHTTDHRFTYFELDRKGAMSFGGGRDAAVHESKPDITLTPEQRAAVWKVITEQHVAEAENFPFADYQTIEYQVDLWWTGSALGRSFRTMDDKSPGTKALHDLLFKYHLDAGSNLPGLHTPAK